MISFDFEYASPQSIKEASETFQQFKRENKKAIYYAGGTEFISRARAGEIKADAIIDLKQVKECQQIGFANNQLVVGATRTLTDVEEGNFYPLLSDVIQHIAHRTARNKITIGGNLMSHLAYREAALPFLLADSTLEIATMDGNVRQVSIHDIFKQDLHLSEGEFIVQIMTDEKFLNMPHFHSKKTKQSKLNYPIVTLAALRVDEKIRVALSGAYPYPTRLLKLEKLMAAASKKFDGNIERVMKKLPTSIIDDMYASLEYRKFLLERSMIDMFQKLERMSS
ncbi:FAD binding domain-containing protein [Virgibacillus soli]|uniref:FAD binding domain-containing protein n=1 Tax=Paracerasibacillus soli TaxID=480284 RepID=A0ABU5CMW2_9BACI|nr:FAD binding domain-containing protein [Virgibacillus soli]MDY0407707.1 FAD binding domain-containing protein [Virgibacillus soli]